MRDQMRREAEAHIRARRWAAAEASLADAHGAADLFIRALARGEQGDIAGARGDVRRGLLAGAPVGEAVALLTRFGLVHEALAAVAELSEADLRAGRIALHFGRYREGIAALERAAGRDPKVGGELSARLEELGDPDAALAHAGRPTARRRRARLLDAMGRREAARALVTRDPSDGDRIAEAELALAVGAIDDAIAASEAAPLDAAGMILRAKIACHHGDGEAGRRWAEGALALGGGREALRWRGIARLLAGEEGAGDDLDAVVAEAPDDPEALLWRGEIARRQGRFEAALADIERGIARTEGYPVAGHASRLATTLAMRAGDGVVDPDAYTELLDLLAPLGIGGGAALTNAALLSRLERALHAFAGNRSARPTFLRAGRLTPLETPIHTRFAARSAQERIRVRPAEQVIAELEALHAARPEPTVICHIGEIQLWLGQAEAAAASFRRALAATAAVRWAYVGLVAASLLAGDLDEALAWCGRGIDRCPPPGRTMFAYRAEVHRLRGDRDAARADLRQCLEDTPDRISAWINLALVDRELLDPVFAKLRRRAPGLVADASRELTGDEIFAGDRARLFEHVLAMMRGNRSSNFVTYFAGSALRFVPPKGTRASSSQMAR